MFSAAAYAVLGVAAAATLFFFVPVFQPTSLGVAALMSLWLLFPYALLALLTYLAKQREKQIANVAVTVLVAGGGLLFLTDVVFLHSDPQGGIAVAFTPIYQTAGIALLLPACRWLFRSEAK